MDELDLVRRHHRRNAAVMLSAVPFWSFGLAFLVPDTALQSFLCDAGASSRVVGHLQTIGLLGLVLPALASPFLFRFFRRTRRVIALGWTTAVLGYVAAGLVLLLTRPERGAGMWLPVLLAFSFHMCLAGLLTPLGVSYTGRVLLPDRRGFVVGLVNSIGGLAGFAGGYLAAWWLKAGTSERYALGYIFGGFCAALWGPIWLNTHETVENEPTTFARLGQYARDLAGIVARERAFRRLLGLMALIFVFCAPPEFMTDHARRNLHGDSSLGGYLTMARFLGLFVGGLSAGWVGDRFGARLLPVIFLLVTLSWFGALLFVKDPTDVIVLTGMRGTGLGLMAVGQTKLIFDLCPRRNKASHGALLYFVIGPTGAASLAASGWLIDRFGHMGVFRVTWFLIALCLVPAVLFARTAAGAAGVPPTETDAASPPVPIP